MKSAIIAERIEADITHARQHILFREYGCALIYIELAEHLSELDDSYKDEITELRVRIERDSEE